MKKYAVIAALLALLTVLAACGVQTLPTDEDDVPPVEGISQPEEDGQTVTKVVYIPMWMKKNGSTIKTFLFRVMVRNQ